MKKINIHKLYKPVWYQILFFLLIVISTEYIYAQEKTVTGIVQDVHGEPLTGVSIVIKNSRTGTVTDMDGNYTITVPPDALLVFSYIGYNSQEVIVGNQSVLNITLKEDTQILEDIVVIGYGSRSKRDITTSISAISSDKVTQVVAMSPEMAMQGQMSGIQVSGNAGDPNSRPTLRIRGTNTWAVSDPLYVIDGIPVKEYGAGIEGGSTTNSYGRGNINIMAMIDPNDIESISVLKDAASAAIYGVRAANGVVLITTKKGRREKPVIEYTQRIGIQNMNKRVDIFNTKSYADYVYNFYKTDPYDPDAMYNDKNEYFDPRSSLYLGNSPTYNWQDAILNKNALTQDYSIRLSGGSEKADYMASFGYSNEDGIKIGSNMHRYSGALKLNVDLNKYVRTGVNLRISYGAGNSGIGMGIREAAETPPWQPIYDPNGIAGYASVIYGRLSDGSWSTRNKYGTMTRTNALGQHATSDNQNEALRMMGNVYLEIEPIKGLVLKGSVSLDRLSNNIYVFEEYRGNVFNINGSDPESEGLPTGSLGQYEERLSHQQNIVWEISANYTKTFNKVHNIDILLNGMAQQYENKYTQGKTRYMTTTIRKARNIPDDESTEVKMWQGYGALVGALLRASYNYDSKYYIDVTLRRDASSRFAPDYRWGTFPGISGAWRISSEEFLNTPEWLDDLKIRASWGKLGNQEVAENTFLQTIETSRARYAWGNTGNGLGYLSTGATVTGLANRRLTWEKTATTNIGIDFSFLNSLTGSIEYYNKFTDGILQDVTLPPSYGVMFAPADNIASVSNRGIELNLNYTHTINDFVFSVGGNLTTVRNRVEKMYEGIPYDTIEEGYSMHYIKGYVIGGILQNEDQVKQQKERDRLYREDLVAPGDFWFVDVRGAPTEAGTFYSEGPDGIVDEYDRVYLGKTIPGYYYGLNLSGQYKGFDISMLFTGVGDVQKVNEKKSTFLNTSRIAANMDPEILNYWRPDNTNTTIPRLRKGDPANNNRFSSYFVENADYFRLSNLQIGYTVPKQVYKSLDNVLSYARIYAGVTNLFTITKFGGLDPEDQWNPAPVNLYFGLSLRF